MSKAKQFVMCLESIVFRIMIAINLQTMDSSSKLTATIDKDAQSRKTHRTLRGLDTLGDRCTVTNAMIRTSHVVEMLEITLTATVHSCKNDRIV